MTRRGLLALVGSAIDLSNLQEAERLLEEAARLQKPQASVLCVQQGSYRYLRAFGEAEADSKFLIASIAKPMTAAGVMWLVDRGKLKMEDPVSKFIPEFKIGERSAMRVSHLLSHTCGLPDMLPQNTDLRKRNAPLEDYTTLALTTSLLFTPGTKWSYSSTGILIASEIAQRIDGRPIAKLLEEELFSPLGMKNTTLGLGRFKVSELIRSQTEYAPGDLGGSQGAPNWDWNSGYWRGLGAPWGGAHSSAADVAKFLQSFLHPDGKPLQKQSCRRMVVNQNPVGVQPYGVGWSVGARLGAGVSENSFGHGGSTGTLCWADPDKDRVFVLLTSLPDAVARKAIIQPVSMIVAKPG